MWETRGIMIDLNDFYIWIVKRHTPENSVKMQDTFAHYTNKWFKKWSSNSRDLGSHRNLHTQINFQYVILFIVFLQKYNSFPSLTNLVFLFSFLTFFNYYKFCKGITGRLSQARNYHKQSPWKLESYSSKIFLNPVNPLRVFLN